MCLPISRGFGDPTPWLLEDGPRAPREKQHFSYQIYARTSLRTWGPDKREHELLPEPPGQMRHHLSSHFADEERGAEEAVLHG